jgi:hypothetical protein
MERRSGRAVFLAGAILAGCGLPIPTPGATACSDHVFIEAGVTSLDCAGALAAVRTAEGAADVSLDDANVEFMAGDDLGEFGLSEAIGRREAGTIAVLAAFPTILVHEALHFRDGDGGHCGWSAPARLALFDRYNSPGSYRDDCAGVVCSSHAGGVWACR